MPTFSLVTPLYEKGRYVEATVRSVLAQTFCDWEMIVVDNGSTDDGPAIVHGFRDDRIQYISISQRGPAVARNRGIERARGEWLQFLDADDLIEPGYLAEQIRAARENPESDIVASSWQNFPDGSLSVRTLMRPTGVEECNPAQALQDSAVCFTPWAPHAAIVRREALPPSLMWPEELDGFLAEDTAFWFRLVCELKVAYSDSAGALYRTQAPGCRTRIDDASKWFEGNHAAACANLRFLTARGRLVSAGQCESLMRFYTQLYLNAMRKKNADTATQALTQAKYWLTQRWNRGTPTTWSIRLRRLLGISGYAHLSRCASMLLRAADR